MIFPDEKKGHISKIIDFPPVYAESKSRSFLARFGPETSFTAPEIFEEMNSYTVTKNYNVYGPPGDVWALGTIFFYLLCGEHPFKGVGEI